MNGKKFGLSLIGAASAAAFAIGGCANSPVSHSTLVPAQSSTVIQVAQAAAPPAPALSAAIFDGDPRFEAPAKNGAAAPRTAWRQGYLVRAVVIESRPIEKSSARHNVLQVTHVYSGPQKLVGQTFRALSSSGIFNGVDMSWPELEIGEQNIWSLQKIDRAGRNSRWVAAREIEASGVWASRLPFTFGEFTPATDEKRSQLLAEAEALAAPVERVERAAPAEQEMLLREYALDPKREVYQWAAHTLVRWKSPGAANFFEQQLQNQTLSIQKQVFFDRALADVAGKSWQRSPQRMQMLERWVNADLSKDDEQVVQNGLFYAISTGKIELEKALALFKKFLIGRTPGNWIDDTSYSQFIGLFSVEKLPRSQAFGFLRHQIEFAPELNTRLAAAGAMRGLLLSSTEVAAIKVLQSRSENQRVKGLLQSTLDFSVKADEARRRRARNAKTTR